MLRVSDIQEAIEAVLGTCSDAEFYSKMNEAVEELANTGLWDPLVGNMDICTDGCQITLPDDVEVPLAINIGGHPADYRNKWFEFHLNGPGSECCGQSAGFNWTDKGDFPTFRDLIKPSTISAFPEQTEALGTVIRVYGYDENEKWIMSPDLTGVLQDGFEVSVIFGLGGGLPSTQKIKRITRVSKPVTNGFVKLVGNDSGETTTGQTLLGLFRPNITDPLFRRITVNGCGCDKLHLGTILNSNGTSESPCLSTQTWARMKFRRKVFKLTTGSDLIPLHSLTALKQACQMIKKYEADLPEEAEKYRALATASLQREQKSRSGRNQMKFQMDRWTYAGSPQHNMI